jgi:cytoskeletal protein CcmA (bactofilin family)
MPDSPTNGPEDKAPEAPSPEMLQPHADSSTPEAEESNNTPTDPKQAKDPSKPRRITYRPSHKATFVGLAVVVVILLINAGIFVFFLTRQSGPDNTNTQRETVTISSDTLEKLGVNREPVGSLGTQLVVGPDARFNGKVTVGNDVNITGQLRLNNKLSTAEASLNKLQAGATSLDQLNVNGDATISNLTLRNNLVVAGTSQLQGAVTVNNNLTVAGNLTVGGALFAGTFQANSLTSGSTLTVGGHIITKGSVPSVSAGPGAGSNGTVSISGTDAAGTIAVNVGAGAGGGVLVNLTFRDQYTNTPHVVITPIGRSAGSAYVNRSASGFSIVVGALSSGGYAFDYVVVQ